MKPDTPTPEIFDRIRRRAMRERAGRQAGANSFLWEHIAHDLADRLAYVSRDFSDILIIGPLAAYADVILGDRKANITLAALSIAEADDASWVVIEEDRLPFRPESFDLIITAGTLDSVNDLPGALIQMRRCLRPDGLLLGNMFGAGTLAMLKTAMIAADGDRITAHIHPQVDLRSAADLLSRAGYALPVADRDILPVRYNSIRRLIADLRDMGVGNVLAGPHYYLGKAAFVRLNMAWNELAAADGAVEEAFILIHISGWAPSPDQPKAAKRGSGKVSMAQILKPPA